MYLELAENNNNDPYSMMAQAPKEDVSDLYLYIPAQFTDDKEGMYVREDSFDLLPNFQWNQLQDVLEPFQQQNLSLFGLGKKGRERRRLRREARQEAKLTRMRVRAETGGGALGKVAAAVKNIFGGGGAAGEDPMTPMPQLPAAPVKAAGFMGMPSWVPLVAIAGIGLAVVAPMIRGRRN